MYSADDKGRRLGEDGMDTLVRFGVKDLATRELVYKTRKADYWTAHNRAERWCKRNRGERGTIVELD